MPIGANFRPSKNAAFAALIAERSNAKNILIHADVKRKQKLQAFLQQQRAVGCWAAACAALSDAFAHGAPISSSALCDTMITCGGAQKMDMVKQLFYKAPKEMRLRKTIETERAFFESCALGRDFKSAHDRLTFVLQRTTALSQVPTASRSSAPLDDEIVCSYLGTAVNATRPKRTGDHRGVGSEWSDAIQMFVSLRRSPVTRSYVPLTSQLLEKVSLLAERGGQWEVAVQLITAAGSQQVLIPPESYDAAIRCCSAAQRYREVLQLTRRCLSSSAPPDESSVRIAMRAAEECSSRCPALSQFPQLTVAEADVVADGGDATAWRLAVRLFQGLRDNGLPLLPQTYESPIRSCALRGRWDIAAKLLGEMKKDERQVPSHVYRLVVLAKIASCSSYEQARAIFDMPIVDQRNPASYCALLRCCIALNDWKHFQRVSDEMKHREIPESYEKMKLLIIAAFMQEKFHGAVARYTRWMQQSTFEAERIQKDQKSAIVATGSAKGVAVRLFAEDFDIERPILNMMLEACDKLKDHPDPAVKVVRADVTRRLAGGRELLDGKSSATMGANPIESWLFSSEARDAVAPKSHY